VSTEREDAERSPRAPLSLYLRTARYLTPRQILSRLVKMWRHRWVKMRFSRAHAPSAQRSSRGVSLQRPLDVSVGHLCEYSHPGEELSACVEISPDGRRGTFRFLAVTRHLDLAAIPWTNRGWDRLWIYNLNYFDYMPPLAVRFRDTGDEALGRALKGLVRGWIEANPAGTECSWDSYPTSLRIRNWIWVWQLLDQGFWEEELLTRLSESVYHQTQFLARNLEFDLGANHLLENCLCLLLSGHWLHGAKPVAWKTRGLRLLQRQLDEQILEDGGHYERSPMYHSIILQHILETAALLPPDSEAFQVLKSASLRMLEFLSGITCRDGEIPLFGDSAFRTAPHPHHLARYASAVLGIECSPPGADSAPIARSREVRSLRGSGFYKLLSNTTEVSLSGRSILSHSQPGHAHCDLFSYEMLCHGERVVVDTGVYTYYGDLSLRDYSRSTRAHNTSMIDDREQLEFWGRFRVASRPRVLAAVARVDDGAPSFYGRYTVSHGWRSRPSVERWIRLLTEDVLLVVDRVRCRGRHTVKSFLHLNPRMTAGTAPLAFQADCGMVRIVPLDGSASIVRDGDHYPEFGRRERNQVVCLAQDGRDLLVVGYLVGLGLDERSFLCVRASRKDHVLLSVGTAHWQGHVRLEIEQQPD